MSALGCVCALRVPTAKCGTLLLGVKARAWPTTTDVGRGVPQIVIAWGCNIEVRLAGITSMRPRRAPILLHDDRCPVWMLANRILHKETLATATDASIVSLAAATAIVVAHKL